MFEVTLKYGHDNAERMVAVAVASIVAENEHTSSGNNVVTATTEEERKASVREVRAITIPAVRARSAI